MNESELLKNITNNIPEGIIGTLLILIVGWVLAIVVRKATYGLLSKIKWSNKLKEKINFDISKFISGLLYAIVMVYLLLIILQRLGMTTVLEPLQNMMSSFLLFFPNLLGGIIIMFIGYLIAKFVSGLVGLLGNVIDKILDRTSFKDTDKLVDVLAKVVFAVIIIPFGITALNKIGLREVSEPVNTIFSEIIETIPSIIGAVAVITIFVIGGGFLKSLLKGSLESVGVDSLGKKLELDAFMGEKSLSKIIASLAFFFLVFFGVITGAEMMGFDELTNILNVILETTGQILFGVVILVIGNLIASVVYKNLAKSEENKTIASIVKYAILGLFLAMALTKMGFADDIVKLAFGLILGTIAVVIALSYGLGGREAAGEHFKEIIKKFKK